MLWVFFNIFLAASATEPRASQELREGSTIELRYRPLAIFCLSVSGSHRFPTGLKFSMKPGMTLSFWSSFLYLENTGITGIYTPMFGLLYISFISFIPTLSWPSALVFVQSLKQYPALLRHPNTFVWWTKVEFLLKEITMPLETQ